MVYLHIYIPDYLKFLNSQRVVNYLKKEETNFFSYTQQTH